MKVFIALFVAALCLSVNADVQLPAKPLLATPALSDNIITINSRGTVDSDTARSSNNLNIITNGSYVKLDVTDQGVRGRPGMKGTVDSIVSGSDVKFSTSDFRMYADTTCTSGCTTTSPTVKTECWVQYGSETPISCYNAFPNADWGTYSQYKYGKIKASSCSNSDAGSNTHFTTGTASPTSGSLVLNHFNQRGTYCFASYPWEARKLSAASGVVTLATVTDPANSYDSVVMTY